MSGWRHETYGQINRDRPLNFTFDGMHLSGFEGDTVASALLAAGPRVLGRSFKYHRPRGLWGMGAEEPNAIFDITHHGKTTPNQRATLVRLEDQMEIRSVNSAPAASNDRFGILDLAHRFLPAGFYYKTFMKFGWMFWEPAIRRMAGLGVLDENNHPLANTPAMNEQCDVLVIGAGPAGLAAARSAALAGKIVWLIDEAFSLGGSLRWRGGQINNNPWTLFVDEVRSAVEEAGGRVFTNTVLWGAFDHGLYAAWERSTNYADKHWRIRTQKVILAAGAIERPLWFSRNDLPGILSAEAALCYLRVYGAVAGNKIVIACAGDAPYAVASAFSSIGCDVTLIDARDKPPSPPDGVKQIINAQITHAIGRNEVTHVVVDSQKIPCDTVLVSGGFTPSVHLHCQAGGKLRFDEKTDTLIPRENTNTFQTIGAANGVFSLSESLIEGHVAGGGVGVAPQATDVEMGLIPSRPDPLSKGRVWIDLQNDVTLKDIRIAAQEGFRSVEHLKRYTTLGMATDQGRNSNFAGLAAMSVLTNQTIAKTGTTTYRPPFMPVPLSVIAGMHRGEFFHSPKRLHLEVDHVNAGATLREYGGWLRPAFYGVDEEKSVQSEALNARENAGLFDASPLGKIEVIGPHAEALLDFCNYMPMGNLKNGRGRYGFMLSETGIVHDDGVILRLSKDHFIVSASSSHVGSVRLILEEARQDRFDPNKVFIHDVSSHWVTLTATGPNAFDLLKNAGIPIPKMTHMSVLETEWDGVIIRIARVSFTGDASWEISVPARKADSLYKALERVRDQHDAKWIGIEALMLLRAEKGYILIGKDTDGITMPHDLGWGSSRQKRQDEYFGRRSLFTPEAQRSDRRQLVGLESNGDVLPTGAHILANSDIKRSIGFVTSSYFSPNLQRPIALALVEAGHSMNGQIVSIFNLGQEYSAKITNPCFIDPMGEKLNG